MKSDTMQLVNVLIKSGKADEIQWTLLGLGVAPCVARELANEPKRRAALAKRSTRQDRCDVSNFGLKRQAYRRIIRTEFSEDQHFECVIGNGRVIEYTRPGREHQLHATKGWRSYRKMA